MKRRDIALAAALLPFASIFAGSTAFAADAGNLKKLRVGVTAGPAAEILEQVVPLAKAKGLDIQIFEFQDYIQPNAALDSGDLDANIFQTIPFMEQTIKDRGYHLNVAGKGFTLPMAFYSKKVKSFAQAPKGATVGIPNDPAMGGRALFLRRIAFTHAQSRCVPLSMDARIAGRGSGGGPGGLALGASPGFDAPQAAAGLRRGGKRRRERPAGGASPSFPATALARKLLHGLRRPWRRPLKAWPKPM